VPFPGFALKAVRGAVKKAVRVELRFYEPLFTTAEHWTPDGDVLHETDESARDELYAKAGEGATAMLFAIVGAATDALSMGGEDRAIEDATLGRVLQALAGLRPRQREVIERRLLQGQEIEDAAREMGISPVTVRRDFSKGLKRLKKLLGAGDERAEDEGEEPEE
jgi:RNA polymerase sigma factor (sigma-70 family)